MLWITLKLSTPKATPSGVLKAGYRQAQGAGLSFVEGRNLSDRSYVATTGVVADAAVVDSGAISAR